MKSYFVYVLKNKTDNYFYTGFTTDLENRVKKHNMGNVKSTKYKIPLQLIYYEVCFNLEDTLHREKYLKTTYGKRYIKNRLKNFLMNN